MSRELRSTWPACHFGDRPAIHHLHPTALTRKFPLPRLFGTVTDSSGSAYR